MNVFIRLRKQDEDSDIEVHTRPLAEISDLIEVKDKSVVSPQFLHLFISLSSSLMQILKQESGKTENKESQCFSQFENKNKIKDFHQTFWKEIKLQIFTGKASGMA